MRFIALIKSDEKKEPAGPPPPELFAAIKAHAEAAARTGTSLTFRGLHPAADRVEIEASPEEVLVTDGPFAEAKEMIGGYADFECASKEAAAELIREFLAFHVDLWPGFTCVCELRQVFHED